ncbi:hypothetical protein CN327_17625 [Bacillus cereus]|nr:hypothetical protein CN327_17625 [Bacillus cereus]
MKKYLLYDIKMKFVDTRVILKRQHIAICRDGKQEKYGQLMSKVYGRLYNTEITHLISIDCREITAEEYKQLKTQIEEEI